MVGIRAGQVNAADIAGRPIGVGLRFGPGAGYEMVAGDLRPPKKLGPDSSLRRRPRQQRRIPAGREQLRKAVWIGLILYC